MSDAPDLPPPVEDDQSGSTAEWAPRPEAVLRGVRGAGKLLGLVALVSSGDGGIGRAVAIAFAREGADVAITYRDEHEDAQETMRLIQDEGRRTMAISGDAGDSAFCVDLMAQVVAEFGQLDILVNNASERHVAESIADISDAQLEQTFRTVVFGAFHLSRAALPYLRQGAAIVNSTCVTAYQGDPLSLDAASAQGAIVSFTRSLARQLASRGIRVNGVASGVQDAEPPLGRAGQLAEVAPAYVYLASADASYVTGQVIHVNGGLIVNG